MRKILALLVVPFFVASCGGLNGVNSDFIDDDDALGGESLNGSIANDYAESRVSADAIQPENQSLLYAGPKYHIGAPYKIEDIQYSPAENYAYNQTGTAGIMPVELDGVSTTNGEKVNTNEFIATSKVLPLPSIVKVTNLDNEQTAVLRVNNRGPFVNSRLLDVSPAAARKLGMTGQTKVRVQVLENESKKVKELTLGAVEAAEVAAVGAPVAAVATTAAAAVASGQYSVQVGAYYSEDSARAIARQVSNIGNATIVQEGGMYKIRMTNLSADDARRAIQRLRSEENMAPGLLKDGRWVNADSI
jgi:rare lipoprotein A